MAQGHREGPPQPECPPLPGSTLGPRVCHSPCPAPLRAPTRPLAKASPCRPPGVRVSGSGGRGRLAAVEAVTSGGQMGHLSPPRCRRHSPRSPSCNKVRFEAGRLAEQAAFGGRGKSCICGLNSCSPGDSSDWTAQLLSASKEDKFQSFTRENKHGIFQEGTFQTAKSKVQLTGRKQERKQIKNTHTCAHTGAEQRTPTKKGTTCIKVRALNTH